jgi:hypothetical protein
MYDFPNAPTNGQVANGYTWDGEKWVSQYDADVRYLNATGDVLTGPLVLAADPTGNMEAATKQYVDNAINNLLWRTDVNGDAILKFGANIVVRIKSTGLILTKDDIEVFSISV